MLFWSLLLFSAIPLGVDAADTFLSFPMDSDPGWVTEGDWEFGVPQGVAGDPTSGFTGTNVYGYNLAGAYTNFPAPHWLTTTAMDCSERVNVTLRLQRWLGVDGSEFPMAAIQVSNNGSDWDTAWMHQSTDPLVDTAWTNMSYDISTIADREPTVYVRWAMGSHDPVITNGGWNIDDVSLEGDPADPLDVVPAIGWEATAYEGGQPFPSNTVYALTNLSSSASFDWSAQASEAWLSIAPTNGTLSPNASTNATVTIDATGLPPGVYSGTFQIDNLSSGTNEIRVVELEVFGVPGEIGIDPAGGFTVTNRIGQQQARVLSVSNTASIGTLEFSLEMRQTGYAPPAVPAPLSMAAPLASYAAMGAPDMVEQEYTFAHPEFSSEGEYDHVLVAGLKRHVRTGIPIVPVQPVSIELPMGRDVVDIRVEILAEEELPGTYLLPPGQELTFPGDEAAPGVTPPDPAVYGQNANWPESAIKIIGTHDKRGTQFASINLFPLKFNPVTGKITYVTRMRLVVELAGGEIAFAPLAMGALASSLPAGGPYKHVIVTSTAFESAPGPWNLQALRDKRIAEGLASTIVTTEWIYSTYDGTRPDGGTDNPTKIRNFLIDAYENWGTEYALLGGGIDVVPARFFRVDHQRDDEAHLVPRIDDFPVDMYYGCLSPSECTFDYNADGYYGEPNDGVGGGEVDLYGEVYVGRAPVEDVSELANFVKKTLLYADSNDPYLQQVSMAGEYLNYGIHSYAKTMLEQVRQGGDYDGFFTRSFENHTRGDIPVLDTSVNLYDAEATWAKSDLADLVNDGVHILNGLGHANETRLFKMEVSDIPMFTNSLYCFMYSQACENGAFDYDDCWAEEVIAMPYGAFAAVMNVRFGWGVPDTTYCPSNRFNREFWDSVFDKGFLELGKANQDAKESLAWDIGGPAMRWSYYELTLFGDPAQRLRFIRPADWLSANPMSGEGIDPGDSVDVDVHFDAREIASGSYTGEITVASNDPGNPEQTVPAVMVVLSDDFAVAPDWNFEVAGAQGSLSLPENATYVLSNTGTGSLDWNASESASWLDISLPSGTLSAGTETNVSLTVNVSANSLPRGAYQATVAFSNTTSGAMHTRSVELDIAMPNPVEFIAFSLDADPGWTTEGEWAFGQPQGLSGDPASAFSGANVYGYNLAGAYSNNMPQYRLTTPPLDCSMHENVALKFRRWLGVEDSVSDHAAIEASSNGSAWVPVWTNSAGAITDSTWQARSYDISAIADGEPTVYIRWAMGATDGSNTYCGWNIDDVSLEGAPVDFDGDGLPDWWEYDYFRSNASPSVSSDVDPYSNLSEYIAGTDPTNGTSYFDGAGSVQDAGDQVVLEWESVSGRWYNIYRSTNMLHGFQTLETDLEYPQNSYTDAVHNVSQGFYNIGVRLK